MSPLNINLKPEKPKTIAQYVYFFTNNENTFLLL